MIPADAPPSFDGHRESTYATVHSVAPFYSVLIRINPENPSSTTDFVCDLCTAMPKPADDGKTYASTIAVTGPGTLRVEGCVGAFCGGENWTRTSR